MPIIIGTFNRVPGDSLGMQPPPPPSVTFPASAVLTTQRGDRFTGYHLFHDTDGNLLYFSTPQAWLNQPRSWSLKETTVGLFDLRSY